MGTGLGEEGSSMEVPLTMRVGLYKVPVEPDDSDFVVVCTRKLANAMLSRFDIRKLFRLCVLVWGRSRDITPKSGLAELAVSEGPALYFRIVSIFLFRGLSSRTASKKDSCSTSSMPR